MLRLILLSSSIFILCSAQSVEFQWNYLNFSWPSTEAYNQAIKKGSYIPENNVLTGIKVWKDRVYLTISRWRNGVPATLISTPVKSISGQIAPLLEPYPNWEMQQLDDCSAFQFVQSMEIDPDGRMWVLENGRTEYMTANQRTKCPTRLVILDLEKNGTVLMDYVFPKEVVNKDTVFINDLVLDHEDGGWAYIADNDGKFPGIIVFSLRDKTSWKITHQSMQYKEEASRYVVNGTEFMIRGTIDGIALSPASTEGDRIVYYTPLASYEIFSVPASVLKNGRNLNIYPYVRLIGRKSSQTDGMIISATGILYYGLLTEDAVASWDTNNPPFTTNQKILVKDSIANQWPDTFAIDTNGLLWWTPNSIQNFITNSVNLEIPNYRVLVLPIAARSYQYYENGHQPQMPLIWH